MDYYRLWKDTKYSLVQVPVTRNRDPLEYDTYDSNKEYTSTVDHIEGYLDNNLGDLLYSGSELILFSASAFSLLSHLRTPEGTHEVEVPVLGKRGRLLSHAFGWLFPDCFEVFEEDELEGWLKNSLLHRANGWCEPPRISEERLHAKDCFRALEVGYIVSERFKDIVDAHGLTNFQFGPVVVC